MTTQYYIEEIKGLFPNVAEPKIIADFDTAQKLFATEVGSVTTLGELSSISTNFAWNLPTGFRRLLDVKMYDANGKPIYFGSTEAPISYEIELDKFYIKSTTSTSISATPSGIDSMYLVYESVPTTLLTRSTSLEIEEEFRDAPKHWVLKNYFANYPTEVMAQGQIIMARDWNAVKYHQGEYERIKLKAKKYVNSKETTLNDTQNYQDAGRVRLPLRELDSSASSIAITTITALGNIYSDFVLYNVNTDDAGVLTEAVQVGFSTIVATKTGASLVLTSTAEFTNDIFIESNNWETSWVTDNTSQITITLPGSFTDLSIQIYKFL